MSRQHNSGKARRSGAITKVGNTRARWIMVEIARQHASKAAKESRANRHRKTLPPEVVAIAEKAEQRARRKFWKIAMRKDQGTAAVATGRELVGFIWAMLMLEAA